MSIACLSLLILELIELMNNPFGFLLFLFFLKEMGVDFCSAPVISFIRKYFQWFNQNVIRIFLLAHMC